jgi:hypothetical protein
MQYRGLFVSAAGVPLLIVSARGLRPSLSPKRFVDQKLGAAARQPDVGEHPSVEAGEFGELPTLAPAAAPQPQYRDHPLQIVAQDVECSVLARVGGAAAAEL